MLIFDNKFKEGLYSKAKESVRRRAHYTIHNDYSEPVQRLAIAILKGSYIPPHKHVLSTQWEFFHLIEGELKLVIFSEEGYVKELYYLGESTGVFAIQIPPGVIHTLVCLSKKAMVFEWKEGPFEPERAKLIPSWVINEQDVRADDFIKCLERIKINDNIRLT